jgi:hypothetical protein
MSTAVRRNPQVTDIARQFASTSTIHGVLRASIAKGQYRIYSMASVIRIEFLAMNYIFVSNGKIKLKKIRKF